MYRSNTGDFLLSLTLFKSFEDELLTYIQDGIIRDNVYYFHGINDIAESPFWDSLFCYSKYNKFLRKFISSLYIYTRNNYIRFLPDKLINDETYTFNKIINIYTEKVNINGEIETEHQKALGICLYKVNLDNFKITKYKYVHTIGLLYDILNSYENCNYFIKIFDSTSIVYTFVDKLIINTFIKTLNLYIKSLHLNHYPIMIAILITLHYLFSCELYTLRSYKRMSNDFEIIRNELKNIRTTKALQINRKVAQVFINPSLFPPGDDDIVNNILKYFINNNDKNLLNQRMNIIRLTKYEDGDPILERCDSVRNRGHYKDFIIYEKDISYYVYDWWLLVYNFIRYCINNIDPISPATIDADNSIEGSTLLHSSLKNYEKSKYFYTKDDFNNKILNNGISF